MAESQVLSVITTRYTNLIVLLGMEIFLGNGFSLGISAFVGSTFGVMTTVFILENGRFLFILLGTLVMLLCPKKKERLSLKESI